MGLGGKSKPAHLEGEEGKFRGKEGDPMKKKEDNTLKNEALQSWQERRLERERGNPGSYFRLWKRESREGESTRSNHRRKKPLPREEIYEGKGLR